jgi:DNA-directed RNA polymerase subunit beta
MPYDENGDPVDICLNPLGVPSRMNVVNSCNSYGISCKGIGKQIDSMIKENAKPAELKTI